MKIFVNRPTQSLQYSKNIIREFEWAMAIIFGTMHSLDEYFSLSNVVSVLSTPPLPPPTRGHGSLRYSYPW